MKVNYSLFVMQRDQSEVEKIAKYYDFIEVQPPKLYQDLIDRELIRDTETLYEIYERILKGWRKYRYSSNSDRKCALFI